MCPLCRYEGKVANDVFLEFLQRVVAIDVYGFVFMMLCYVIIKVTKNNV